MSTKGELAVSTHGVYLTGPEGHRFNRWTAIDQADIVEPQCVQFSGTNSSGGSGHWRMHSDWAELAFAYWCLARNQNHPQWLNGSWFPIDMMRQRTKRFAKDLPGLTPPS